MNKEFIFSKLSSALRKVRMIQKLGHGNKKNGLTIDKNELDLDTASLGSILDDEKKPNQLREHRKSSALRRWAQHSDIPYIIGAQISEENQGLCGKILIAISWFLIILFFPFSLFITIKVVQEYE